MKPVFLLLLLLLGGPVAASPAWAGEDGMPPWRAPGAQPHRLRDAHLREAVTRGELTRDEARDMRRQKRWQNLSGMPPPPMADERELPRPKSPRQQRWRQQLDAQRAPQQED